MATHAKIAADARKPYADRLMAMQTELDALAVGNLAAQKRAALANDELRTELARQRDVMRAQAEQIERLREALYATMHSSPCISIHCRHYDLAGGRICHIEAANKARAALAGGAGGGA